MELAHALIAGLAIIPCMPLDLGQWLRIIVGYALVAPKCFTTRESAALDLVPREDRLTRNQLVREIQQYIAIVQLPSLAMVLGHLLSSQTPV